MLKFPCPIEKELDKVRDRIWRLADRDPKKLINLLRENDLLGDYKKKGYSSALEYRIDLMRDKLSRKFSSVEDYAKYIKNMARLNGNLLVKDKGKSYKAGKGVNGRAVKF